MSTLIKPWSVLLGWREFQSRGGDLGSLSAGGSYGGSGYVDADGDKQALVGGGGGGYQSGGNPNVDGAPF